MHTIPITIRVCFITFFLISTAHAAVLYTLHDLGAGTRVSAVNSAGVMAGSVPAPHANHAARFQLGSAPLRLDTLGDYFGSGANAINTQGTIVGGGVTTFRWTEAGGLEYLAPEFYAQGINDTETITGYRDLITVIRPVVHIMGTMSDLGTLNHEAPFTQSGYALGINAQGDIVGESETVGNTTFHATLWPIEGGIIDLDPGGIGLSIAYALNASRQVTGQANGRAFRYTIANGMVSLGTLPGFGSSSAYGINTAGKIVGSSIGLGPFPPPIHAWQWTAATGMEDLNSLVQAPGWVLEQAFDVNDQDLIVGSGKLDGVPHAFVLTPYDPTIPMPPVGFVAQVWAELNFDGWWDLAGVDSWNRIWRCLSGEAACTQLPGAAISLISGDFDADGIDDLAALGGDWSIWTMLDGQHWQQVPGYLQTFQTVSGTPDGMMGLGWEGATWYAATLGAWRIVPQN